MTDSRGPTYTELHRHQCEVRHVLALPSRMARLAYIEGHWAEGKFVKGIRQHRGDRAADALRDDVRAAWQQMRAEGEKSPAPADGERAHAAALRSLHEVNASSPVDGSFLGPAAAGDSDPVRGVVSGVPAR